MFEFSIHLETTGTMYHAFNGDLLI